jgi:DNA repair photolyase
VGEEKAKVRDSTKNFRGRGVLSNPENRYERVHVDLEEEPPTDGRVPSVFYRDASRTVLAENDSPDVGFRFSLNPYRGCEHGCVYCYARPSHEYLGFSAGIDFESRIMIKEDAPALLRRAFLSPQWKPQVVALSGNTDCYQPVERRLRITRGCLQVCCEFVNPVSVVTKSSLVTRDIDLLAQLASKRAAEVTVSVTTLDAELARRMEPRAARPEKRLQAVSALRAAGIPTGVMIAPVIPGLNDEEIPAISGAAAAAGAQTAGWLLLRLARPNDKLFSDWLAEQFPQRQARVLNRLRSCRNGNLGDSRFGFRMRGEGPYARQIEDLFDASVRRYGLNRKLPELSTAAFQRPPQPGEQLAWC